MPVSVTSSVKLSSDVSKFLSKSDLEDGLLQEYETFGGVLSIYTWLFNGPRLAVVNTKTGKQVGFWTFGYVLRDVNTKIVCLAEIRRPNKRSPLLAVGLDCDFSGGMLCIFDFLASKVIRAIRFDNKITSLHVIDSGCDVFMLPGPLRSFDGIIAVGTTGGDVFLVDICRQICDEGLKEARDELNPCMLLKINLSDLDEIEGHKQTAVTNNHHLAIHLNDNPSKHFVLKGPKGDNRALVNKEEVIVSAVFYCPQLGSLLIGYNFGAFQLFNLMTLRLVYTSPISEENIPITRFALQEPADDPKAVCYIWAVYSSDEQFPSCLPLAVMYAFNYHSKEYHEGYGCLYEEFISASVLFQMELGASFSGKKRRGGHCLNIKAITNNESSDDHITLCAFVWNIWFSDKEYDTFLAVFDLNQWYKEQMPSVASAQYSSTYLYEIHLNGVLDGKASKNAPILDVYVDQNAVKHFKGAQRLEEHFYPSSVTFAMTCLRESDLIFMHNYGSQRALLVQMESSGSLCLVEPAEIYHEIVALGLAPLFIEPSTTTPISTNQQREVILSTALENHLIGWLCKCAQDWANGSFLSTGCSLDFLINWAFNRAITLKKHCDSFCTCLFDFSGLAFDSNTSTLFNSCTRQLNLLSSLYSCILSKLSSYINFEVVQEQAKSLENVTIYFEVLQWFLNVGLLPEASGPRLEPDRISVPYPAESLTTLYNQRRAMLKVANEQQFCRSEAVLFIDLLIEKECGGAVLQEQWTNDGGNGFYPPPSLQALLRTYLVENVSLDHRHSIVTYLLLDLAMLLDHDRYKAIITYLIKFPSVFKVSSSLIKLTQAFWQLDHADFNTAMGLLLDIPSNELKPWHHKLVLNALMLQGQHNFALFYFRVRKPVCKDEDDALTAITLYVANNMIDDAFYLERQFPGDRCLTHLFKECTKHNKLKPIVYRNLNESEESAFLKYLKENSSETNQDLNVFYHILRCHYLEAFQSLQNEIRIEQKGLVGQTEAKPREKFLHNLKTILPDVTRDLINVCQKGKTAMWNMAQKNNAQYKSNYLTEALLKAKQTFSEAVTQKIGGTTESTPFLRTPMVRNNEKRDLSVLVDPKIVDIDQWETSPPAAKRMKLSPRFSNSFSRSISVKLETPVVQRKTPRRSGTEEKRAATPQSILKTPGKKDKPVEVDESYTPVTALAKKPGSHVKSSIVRFEGLSSLSSSNTSTSPDTTLEDKETITKQTPLCSPRKSYRNSLTVEEKKAATPESEDNFKTPLSSPIKNISTKEKSAEKANAVETNSSPSKNKTEETAGANLSFSPRSRKSYRNNTEKVTPTRSSPRLSKSLSGATASTPSEEEESKEQDSSKSSILPKLRARRSLCRQVLVTNAINRALTTPETLQKSGRSNESKTRVEEKTEVLESKITYEDGEENRTLSLRHTINSTISFAESDSSVGSIEEENKADLDKAKDQSLIELAEVMDVDEEKEDCQIVTDTEHVEEAKENDPVVDKEVIKKISEESVEDNGELVYASLQNVEHKEEDRNATEEKTVEHRTSPPMDAAMNNFEMSDDLSLNDGFVIQQEVTFGEKDLCYGQQSTLENVLEQDANSSNVNYVVKEETVTLSDSPNELEKNVLNISYEAQASKTENIEIIEIGSSSEDETNNSNSSKSSDESRSSNSNRFTEVSEDESEDEEFQGEILRSEEHVQKEVSNSSESSQDYSSEDAEAQPENKTKKSEESATRNIFHTFYNIDKSESSVLTGNDEQLDGDKSTEISKEGVGLFQGEILFEEVKEKLEETSKNKEMLEEKEIQVTEASSKQETSKLNESVEVDKTVETSVDVGDEEISEENITRNIFDTFYNLDKSESSKYSSKDVSGISETSERTREGFGLFEGDILLNTPKEENKKNKEEHTKVESQEDSGKEPKTSKLEPVVEETDKNETRKKVAESVEERREFLSEDKKQDGNKLKPVEEITKTEESLKRTLRPRQNSDKSKIEVGDVDNSEENVTRNIFHTFYSLDKTQSNKSSKDISEISETFEQSREGFGLFEGDILPNISKDGHKKDNDEHTKTEGQKDRRKELKTSKLEPIAEKTDKNEDQKEETLPLESGGDKKQDGKKKPKTSKLEPVEESATKREESLKRTLRPRKNSQQSKVGDEDNSEESTQNLTRNVFHTFYDLEKTQSSKSSKYINDVSVDQTVEQTREGFGLFEGDILTSSSKEDKKDNDEHTKTESPKDTKKDQKTSKLEAIEEKTESRSKKEESLKRTLRPRKNSDKSKTETVKEDKKEKFFVQHNSEENVPRNIFHTFYNLDKSESSVHSLNVSEDRTIEETKEGFGLFEGDILVSTPKEETSKRTLRPRKNSTEKSSTLTLRKRSSSMDEPPKQQTSNKPKSRNRRAASVSIDLPGIQEENEPNVRSLRSRTVSDDTLTLRNRSASLDEAQASKAAKKSSSLLDGRRVTRKQASILEKVGESLESMDPIVLLDKMPFEGRDDPDERKVYDVSPSSSSSPSIRRSKRSKSRTPVRTLEEDVPGKSLKRRLEDIKEEETVEKPKRVTRSKKKSESSEDSVTLPAKRTRRAASQTLEGIKE